MYELDDITIRAAAKKRPGAFRKLYDHYSPFVWKVVFRTVNGDMDAATQIMQDVFVKAYFALKSYRFNAAFSTWLYRIAYTTALNHIRRRKTWQRRFGELNEGAEQATADVRLEAKDLVQHMFSGLNPQERFLLTAREIDNISFDDLERMTGKSSGALRTQLSRLKESLRKEYSYAQQQ